MLFRSLMVAYPVALEQHFEHTAVQSAWTAIVNVLGHRMVSQFRVPQAQGKAAVVSPGGFVVE